MRRRWTTWWRWPESATRRASSPPLKSCGVSPVKTVALADHQALAQSAVAALATPQQTLLMTEKDAVKCREFAQANWWYLPVDAIMTDQRAQRLLTDLVTLAQR
ncbi:tetraacyldisaccharide 4'-kinase [Escherichia coli]